jgi:hypothetical protein
MKKLIGFIFGILIVAGCSSAWDPTPTCPGNDIVCNGLCYDPYYYACDHGRVILINCGQGLQMCNGACVEFPSSCCGSYYCYAQQCGSQHTCMPIGATDCGNGKYCLIGHYCMNGGTACSP